MLEVPLDRRMQALLAVAEAVADAHELEDVLELAAEEARAILGVSLLSFSRFEPEDRTLRTVINVGELEDGWPRWPEDEVYTLDDYHAAHGVIYEGRPRLSFIDDPRCDPSERALMHEWNMTSCAAVPVSSARRVWGEMWAANRSDRLPLRTVDVQFMQAICTQVALADRARRAVLPARRRRLPRSPHRPRQPARLRRGARCGRSSPGRSRSCSATSTG